MITPDSPIIGPASGDYLFRPPWLTDDKRHALRWLLDEMKRRSIPPDLREQMDDYQRRYTEAMAEMERRSRDGGDS